MDNWPNIPLPTACPSGIRDPLLEDEFQSGDDAARPQFAAPRCLPITLSWNWMHKTHLATLRTFQKAHRADLFLWEDPFTGEQWEARFAGEEPVQWSPIAKLPDHAQVTATIKPVNEIILPADAPVTKRKPSYILSAEIGLSSEVVQRASEQTYRREDGSLGVMPINTLVPTVKNGRKCFEIYGGSTNELLWSRDLSNPVWKCQNCTIDINGLMTPTLRDPIVRQYLELKENVAYTYTIEARADVPQEGQLYIIQRTPYTVISHPSVWLTKDWQRFELTFILAESGSYEIRFDGHNDGVLLSQWRNPQLEKGESPSPRIPTSDSFKARHATNVEKEAGDWFNLTEGTFVVELDKTGHEDARVIFALGNSFAGSLYSAVGVNYINFICGDVGGISVDIENGTTRLAVKYSTTSLSLAVNGHEVVSRLLNLTPQNWKELCIGKASWWMGNHLNSSIYSLIYYPEAVTDEELKAFSEVRHA